MALDKGAKLSALNDTVFAGNSGGSALSLVQVADPGGGMVLENVTFVGAWWARGFSAWPRCAQTGGWCCCGTWHTAGTQLGRPSVRVPGCCVTLTAARQGHGMTQIPVHSEAVRMRLRAYDTQSTGRTGHWAPAVRSYYCYSE